MTTLAIALGAVSTITAVAMAGDPVVGKVSGDAGVKPMLRRMDNGSSAVTHKVEEPQNPE